MAKSDHRTRPLYVEAHQKLVSRIRSGHWAPGEALPNEFEIAAELGMSQGTVRKALDQLTDEGLIVRHQGRGTFVANRTPEQWQFRFFNFYDPANRRIIPESRQARPVRRPAKPDERRILRLDADADVVAISRVRTARGQPFVCERMILPASRVPELEHVHPIPNTIYDHLRRRYSIFVTRAEERVTAMAATRADAERLSIETGAPLLRVDRIAFDIDERPIEWRQSRMQLGHGYYLAHLK